MTKHRGKLCIFGCYKDSELYPRNRTLIATLSSLFDSAIEIRAQTDLNGNGKHRPLTSPLGMAQAIWRSVTGFGSLYRQRDKLHDADLYYIPYPAYLDLFYLQLLTGKRHQHRIVIDSFLCLHDTIVHDRKMLKHGSILARLISRIEGYTLRQASLILIDTEQQKKLLVESYALDKNKVIVTPVGIDESTWTECPPLPLYNQFRVLFWGTFIPLHGIETIIEAARIFAKKQSNIRFTLIGDGQTADEISKKLIAQPVENLEWRRELVSAQVLRSELENSHCILGVFGTSAKTGNVIPYKAYQAMASNKILITRDSPAFRKIFGDQTTIVGLYLTEPGSATLLAEAITDVFMNYDEIFKHIATRVAYDLKLSNFRLSKILSEEIPHLFDGNRQNDGESAP
ncbi:glycosyltransferase [Seongchinamella unica]|uniref:Glycosyltransferase n=1 Tax=Seongchinamella unica TaxID=2547392 RepID=A0A4V2ZX28_9GAMM|nr:glycosyltransferase [Seongchinamella unica]TDG12753.1 glycosyltransferase [Seongchinamella unica]